MMRPTFSGVHVPLPAMATCPRVALIHFLHRPHRLPLSPSSCSPPAPSLSLSLSPSFYTLHPLVCAQLHHFSHPIFDPCTAMEYEKSGISSEDVKRYALVKDPSTVTVLDSGNLGEGVETGSTGERDMHSDATSEKHSASYNDGRKEDSSSGSGAGTVSDLRPTTEDSYGGGLYGTDSTPSSQEPGHASDFQSAEGLESDMPDRRGIREPPSSGNRATDITGISYIQ